MKYSTYDTISWTLLITSCKMSQVDIHPVAYVKCVAVYVSRYQDEFRHKREMQHAQLVYSVSIVSLEKIFLESQALSAKTILKHEFLIKL